MFAFLGFLGLSSSLLSSLSLVPCDEKTSQPKGPKGFRLGMRIRTDSSSLLLSSVSSSESLAE